MRNADMPAMPTCRKTANELENNEVMRQNGGKGFLGTPLANTIGAGLTKREYFAALAMQGLLSQHDFLGEEEYAAEMSVRFSDALLAELEKTS